MKFNIRFYKNQESGKGKRPNEQSSNEKGKGFFKGKKFEQFNYGGLGHYAHDFLSPKDIKKKSIQSTLCDTESKESASTIGILDLSNKNKTNFLKIDILGLKY